MPNLADKILQELKYQQICRKNLIKEDLEKEYLKLEKENFPDDKRIKFIANLGGSDEVAYHYELICKQWREDRQLNLESSFDKHGGDGIEFLLEQLTKTADQNLKISTIYLAAQILSKSKHRDFYAAFCDRLIPHILSFMNADNVLRQKLIIALGWIGRQEEIDILTGEMLSNKDSLCRAWSAASLMQMSFYRVKQKILRIKTKTAFIQSISAEKDLYACAVMIEAAQILFGKKWISSAAQNQEAEKIEKARKSAIRFLSKS
ncbi:HEAT repeat domain-containing protein [uncultured Campylobacter sp.]|uniref:HEAT repeat domain-containing protein n=1 Tax=uncultured Campylobacter sp. TaxID=218934 RepID=UPI0026172E86|nr:HEAT repeat domain-containing protein [uncultured Campylobacter sp.]